MNLPNKALILCDGLSVISHISLRQNEDVRLSFLIITQL